MTALGSSFAAGPGIRPIDNLLAGRSKRNYAHLTAEVLGATLVDATVSGATTATILSDSQRVGPVRFRPQLDSVDPWSPPDLVTITAGGNDLAYLGSMVATASGRRFAERAVTRRLGRRILAGVNTHVTEDQVAGAAAGLARIVDRVRELAPAARILLVDYLTIIGPDTRPSEFLRLTEADLDDFRMLGAAVGRAFRMAASESSAELVDVAELSRDHATDSAEPWVNGFTPGLRGLAAAAFHPNLAGMEAVSRAIVDHIEKTPDARA